MTKSLQAVRGMNDILPSDSNRWLGIEKVIRCVLEQYGYRNIRTPIIEPTGLFARGIGEHTDIVEKEMYTFMDRNGDSLTLRPEGTAGCVRAAIQHGLLYNQVQRLWTSGPMFRYERPQKGRYRQFHQLSVETYGMTGAAIDAELILMTSRFWQNFGIADALSLEVNNIGSSQCRASYREALVSYLQQHEMQLDDDSRCRLTTNPLRILDSKNEHTQAILDNAPVLSDFLDKESAAHLDELCEVLEKAGVAYTINRRLVRGLDYYNDTVFEWTTKALGSQSAVCGGGRYDKLVELLGGRPVPASGFAIGLERLVLLLETLDTEAEADQEKADIVVVVLGKSVTSYAMHVAEKVRTELPALTLLTNCQGGSFKSQMKVVARENAKIALLIGEDECNQGKVTVKWQKEEGEQVSCSLAELLALLKRAFPEAGVRQV